MLAAELGATGLMRVLIEAKADQAAVHESGGTALDMMIAAVKLGNGQVGHALMFCGADVNVRNAVRTPAMDVGQRREWTHRQAALGHTHTGDSVLCAGKGAIICTHASHGDLFAHSQAERQGL